MTSDGEVIKFGSDSLLEMTLSAYLSQCNLYAVFECTDLKNSCDPTENIPSWFDRVCNFVWYNADACVSFDTYISHLVYPKMCGNL